MIYFDERRRMALSANHPDTIALLNYAAGKSITMYDAETINALDAFYNTNGISALINNKLDIYYHFCGSGSSAFKLLNAAKKNNNYDATGNGGLVWGKSGAVGNGTNAYISTNFNPSLLPAGQKYQLNAASRGSVVYDNPSTTALEATIDGGGSISNTMFAVDSNGNKINQGASNASGNNDLSGTGLKAIIRTTASTTNLYNKAVVTTSTTASTVIGNANQIIHARDNAGVLAYGKLTLSNYLVGGILDATDIALIRSAVNNQLAALSLTQIA